MKTPNRIRPETEAIANRATVGHNSGRVEVVGRDGKPLMRKRGASADPFYVPEDLKEPGWSYRWVRFSTYNMEDRTSQMNAQENGWMPAKTKPLMEHFLPPGHPGPILRDGLCLCERPQELTDEAMAEEKAKADGQWKGSHKRFGFTPTVSSGFAINAQAKAATFRNITTEPLPADVPRPQHQVVVDE